MNGTSSVPRIWVIRASGPMKRRQTATVMMLEITMVHTIASVTARCPFGAGVSIAGPGTRPWTKKAPMRIAVATLAGTPNATVVTRLPPSEELLAAPGPSTPSTAPLPNRSRPGELWTACAYASHWVVAAPNPGMIEMNVPSALQRMTSRQWRKVSRTPSHTPPTRSTSSFAMLDPAIAISISSGIA